MVGSASVRVTLSVGAATSNGGDQSFEQLLDLADKALYGPKKLDAIAWRSRRCYNNRAENFVDRTENAQDLVCLTIGVCLLAACGSSTNTPAPGVTTAPSAPNGGATPVPTLPLTPPGLPAGGFPLLDVPLGGTIVYNNGDGDIHVIEPKPGSTARTLISPPDNKGFLQEPAWSPDGTHVAYSYLLPFDTSGLPAQDILQANADGKQPQTIVAHSVNGEVYAAPAYSPDGRYLYFSHSSPIFSGKQISGVNLTLDATTSRPSRPARYSTTAPSRMSAPTASASSISASTPIRSNRT